MPPHTATILRTTEADQREGMPKYILAGLVLRDGEPNTASFAVPLIVEALRRAVEEVNAKEPGAIRTLRLFEFELTFKHTPVQEVAASLAAATAR